MPSRSQRVGASKQSELANLMTDPVQQSEDAAAEALLDRQPSIAKQLVCAGISGRRVVGLTRKIKCARHFGRIRELQVAKLESLQVKSQSLT